MDDVSDRMSHCCLFKRRHASRREDVHCTPFLHVVPEGPNYISPGFISKQYCGPHLHPCHRHAIAEQLPICEQHSTSDDGTPQIPILSFGYCVLKAFCFGSFVCVSLFLLARDSLIWSYAAGRTPAVSCFGTIFFFGTVFFVCLYTLPYIIDFFRFWFWFSRLRSVVESRFILSVSSIFFLYRVFVQSCVTSGTLIVDNDHC